MSKLENYGILGIGKGLSLPFMIAVPQCPSESYWNMERDAVMALITELTANYRIDSNRIYLIGYSMGAYGVWDLAIHYPDKFAAIVPISSGGQLSKAARLKATPVWAFHGALDDIVPIEQMTGMVHAVEQYQTNTKLTVYPDLGHDIMECTLNKQELYDWLLEQKKEMGGQDMITQTIDGVSFELKEDFDFDFLSRYPTIEEYLREWDVAAQA